MSEPKTTILIIDKQNFIANIVKEENFDVIIIDDCEKASETVEAKLPDLILINFETVGKDIYNTCKMLQDSQKNKTIPIIFVNTLIEYFNKAKGYASGMADYVPAPLLVQELLSRIEYQLASQKGNLELRQKNAELNQAMARISDYEAQINQLALTDPLTQVFNQRYFLDLAAQEIERAAQNKLPLTLILFDIDNFADVNNTHGHMVSNQVLVNLVKLCQIKIRDLDVLARWENDVFAILMPDTTMEEAHLAAERLRSAVFESFMATGRVNVLVTISMGLTNWDGNSPDMTIVQLVEDAQAALTQAKESGTNQIYPVGK